MLVLSVTAYALGEHFDVNWVIGSSHVVYIYTESSVPISAQASNGLLLYRSE